MMPKYEEVEDMTAEQTQAMIDKALADRDTMVATANAKTASWSADAWGACQTARRCLMVCAQVRH